MDCGGLWETPWSESQSIGRRAMRGMALLGAECSPLVAPRANGSFCSPSTGHLLPSLILIGSLKTGSSSLWAKLVDNSHDWITPGALTHKGDISRKEKDFFGDPSQWRLGRRWYEKIWPQCPHGTVVAVDFTPAYHVWYDAPQNMATFFGPQLEGLRLVWMVREPVAKFWSYYWELKSYRGSWDSVSFDSFVAPKLERTRACLEQDPSSPLWPPSLPPPYSNCAPHLDHGLYAPQLQRWLRFFKPSQLLLVSFLGYKSEPARVIRDVMVHSGLPPHVARKVSIEAAEEPIKSNMLNSRSRGHGRMPARWRCELRNFYRPFVERFYSLVRTHSIPVSPCEAQNTRFLDPPNGTDNYHPSVICSTLATSTPLVDGAPSRLARLRTRRRTYHG